MGLFALDFAVDQQFGGENVLDRNLLVFTQRSKKAHPEDSTSVGAAFGIIVKFIRFCWFIVDRKGETHWPHS